MASREYKAPKALGETLEDLRRHASTTFGVAALISLPVPFVAVYAAVRPTYLSTTVQTVVNTLAAWWVAYAIVLATQGYAQDANPGVLGALRRSRSGLLRYVGARILLGLIIVATVVVAALAGAVALSAIAPDLFTPARLSLGAIAGAVLVIGPLVVAALLFVYLRVGLGPTATALEGRGAAAGLGRSRTVTKGHRLDFLVLLFMVWVVTIVVQIVVQGPGQMVTEQAAPLTDMDLQDLSIDELMDQALTLPSPASPPAAVVIGVSTYLSLLILESFIAGFTARFYLALTAPEEPTSTEEAPTHEAEIAQGPAEGGNRSQPSEGPKPGD